MCVVCSGHRPRLLFFIFNMSIYNGVFFHKIPNRTIESKFILFLVEIYVSSNVLVEQLVGASVGGS